MKNKTREPARVMQFKSKDSYINVKILAKSCKMQKAYIFHKREIHFAGSM